MSAMLRDQILEALVRVSDDDDRLLVLHCSLAHLRLPSDGTRAAMLDALGALVNAGRTVAVPTYTFAFCKSGLFDPQSSRSEVGLLGDWLLAFPGASRTAHPIYSYAVAGPLAPALHACRNSTTFGADSVFALFEDLDARYLMLGCGWKNCSQFHRYEEEAAVPYRHFKDFKAVDSGAVTRMFVRRLDIVPEPQNDFSSAEKALRDAGEIRSAPLGAGTVESASSRAIAKVCRSLLGRDPYALAKKVDEPVSRKVDVQSVAEPVKVALLGSCNLEPLALALRQQLRIYLRDRDSEVYTVPFGQLPQQLLAPGSRLHGFRADVTLFVDRLEDILRVDSLDEALRGGGRMDALSNHLDGVSRYLEAGHSRVAIARFAIEKAHAQPGADRLVAQCNERLAAFAAANPGVYVFDPLQAGATGPMFDARTWYLGRIPYGAAFNESLAGLLCGIVLARIGRGARALVVDLDNTLWGGVLGEDGVGGVQIGGDFPGNCFAAFQRALRSLMDRGLALAVCSKNDADLVSRAFSERPEMVLHKKL